ncbi:MAG: hypothetical protein CMQ03_06685 [Gammaproteobacteria bacterium]|nr:hypothetical protein [Gammaproteobacteria bacterium]
MALTRTIKTNKTLILNHPFLKEPTAFRALISQPMGQYAPYLSSIVYRALSINFSPTRQPKISKLRKNHTSKSQ